MPRYGPKTDRSIILLYDFWLNEEEKSSEELVSYPSMAQTAKIERGAYMANKKSLAIYREHKKKLGNHQSKTPGSPEPCSPCSYGTSESDEDFPPSVAVPARTTRSQKRKSDATSVSDTDLAPPARQKPGPKPKTKPTSDGEDIGPEKPAKGKRGPKPKTKTKATPLKGKKTKKIVLMVPKAATEGSLRVSLKSSVSFDHAIELMHETIGCVSVGRKPTLAYKFSTATKNAPTINLRTKDDWIV
ncbi:hypothetical protein B0H13DRAFT_1851987 [Mycena leptocephala]|nr:hypothetical protein B0H13DRAFT_1851987 [Mycena leptocephala]